LTPAVTVVVHTCGIISLDTHTDSNLHAPCCINWQQIVYSKFTAAARSQLS